MEKQLLQLDRQFRPEIEGLRVVAALLVATYHIWFNRVSGGVDVFFVISGFLITASIISTINRTEKIRFLPYITKLFKRLLPAVFFILTIVLMLSFFFLPASILEKTVREIIASMFYYENWQLAFSSTDYLDSQQMKTPVEHFWAMSIQGQFYLIWFIIFASIVFIIKKFTVNNTRLLMNGVLGFLTLTSLIYSVYLTNTNQAFAYFHTFARLWEFAIGGLVCINLSYIKINKSLSVILGWAGLIGLLLTGAVFDVSTKFPGYIALWPIFCAIFILMASTNSTKYGVNRLLASPTIVKLGGISFGIYLWHWVLLSFYHYTIDSSTPSLLVGLLIIIISIILSYLMTKFIEKPIRLTNTSWKSFSKISFIAGVNLSLIALLALNIVDPVEEQAKSKEVVDYPGAIASLGKVEVAELPPIPSFSYAFDDVPQSHIDESNQGMKYTDVKIGEYGELEDYDATIAIVGGSHSQHWLGAVIKAAESQNYRILNITRSGTRFTSVYNKEDDKAIWVENTLDYISKTDIDIVVAHGTTSDTKDEQVQEGLALQLQKVANQGIEVLALRDNPRYSFNVLESLEQSGEDETIKKMNAENNQLDKEAWQVLEMQYPEFHTLDLTNHFKVDGQFKPIIGNIVVYRDFDHITNTYSESFSPLFIKKINDILIEKNK